MNGNHLILQFSAHGPFAKFVRSSLGLSRRFATTLSALSLLSGVLVTSAQGQLVADWKADGNTIDSSGNGHDGSTVGSVTYGAGVSGGKSFQLSGSDYISVPASLAWGFGSNAFSINVWANFSSFYGDNGPGQLGHTFVGQDAGGGSTDKWVFFQSGSNLWFHINGPDAGGTAFLSSPDSISLTTGIWNMFTITRSGSSYTFYDDGVSLGTTSSSLNVPYSGTPLTIGQAEAIGQFYGGLTDISIYDGALTGSQISSLYSAGTSTPSPAAAIPFLMGVICRRRRK